MDNETVRQLWALRKMNGALLDGLKAAIFVLEKEEQLTKKRRKSVIKSLKYLIAESEEIYGEAPAEH